MTRLRMLPLNAAIGSAAIAAIMTLVTGSAHAQLQISTSPTPASTAWVPHAQQSIPSGLMGYVDGALSVQTAGYYTFTFGAPFFSLPGGTGSGGSIYPDEFWVGQQGTAGRQQAELLGDAFCTQAGNAHCSASITDSSFTVFLNAGVVPFHFTANSLNSGAGGLEIDNGVDGGPSPTAVYLTTVVPVSKTAPDPGPGGTAFVALEDDYPVPADVDYQDLVVQIDQVIAAASVPEASALAIMAVSLLGLLAVRLWSAGAAAGSGTAREPECGEGSFPRHRILPLTQTRA